MRALAALGAFGDERARRALDTGIVSLLPIGRRWGGSEGEISAHVVLLGLDAATLGALAASPQPLVDVTAALAAALAETPNQTLDGLRPYWAFEERSDGPYRGGTRVDVDRADGEQLTRGARAYLEAKNEAFDASRIRSITAHHGDGVWHAIATLTLCTYPTVKSVEACLEHLLTGAEGDQVFVRCTPLSRALSD